MCINQGVSHSKFKEMDIFEVPFALKCANNANFLKKSGFLRRLKLVIVTIKTQGNSLKVSLEIRKSVKNWRNFVQNFRKSPRNSRYQSFKAQSGTQKSSPQRPVLDIWLSMIIVWELNKFYLNSNRPNYLGK